MKLRVPVFVMFVYRSASSRLVVVRDVNVSMLQPGVQDQPAVCDLSRDSCVSRKGESYDRIDPTAPNTL